MVAPAKEITSSLPISPPAGQSRGRAASAPPRFGSRGCGGRGRGPTGSAGALVPGDGWVRRRRAGTTDLEGIEGDLGAFGEELARLLVNQHLLAAGQLTNEHAPLPLDRPRAADFVFDDVARLIGLGRGDKRQRGHAQGEQPSGRPGRTTGESAEANHAQPPHQTLTAAKRGTRIRSNVSEAPSRGWP